jgi:hypothetical protein
LDWKMNEYLPAIRVAVDAAMVTLILLVQLIIYPSFRAIEDDLFTSWHRRYVVAIGFVVIPLMLVQAGCIGVQLLAIADGANILSAAAVLGAWIVTFTLSAPYHRKLQQEGKSREIIDRLIQTNWLRTACWIMVFVAGFVQGVFKG